MKFILHIGPRIRHHLEMNRTGYGVYSCRVKTKWASIFCRASCMKVT